MNISATELSNFRRKYYLLHELLILKYWRQNISVSNIALHAAVSHNAPAHRARETVHLLTHETPDFITPALWPANSPDLNPVDYQIWGKLQERVYCSQIHDVDQMKSRLIEEWNKQWYLENNARQRHSYNWRLIGNHIWPIKRHKYQWPWVSLKVTTVVTSDKMRHTVSLHLHSAKLLVS